ncbi:hypothetical protein GGR54DRAFT_153128 [Hypoxylon sp. NC1633]|nr:hypothetical protein GGR54DRAFT_153128 [Hypoxylon sp. NC1633]
MSVSGWSAWLPSVIRSTHLVAPISFPILRTLYILPLCFTQAHRSWGAGVFIGGGTLGLIHLIRSVRDLTNKGIYPSNPPLKRHYTTVVLLATWASCPLQMVNRHRPPPYNGWVYYYYQDVCTLLQLDVCEPLSRDVGS